MGQAPGTGNVSLRTFPRNFQGRSGSFPDRVYLCSPETAVASAIFGKITDPRKLGKYPEVLNPETYVINDDNLIYPPKPGEPTEIIMGPNIKPFPEFEALGEDLEGLVALKVDDNITTDHIMPAGSKILPFRSNIPAISEFVFTNIDPDFPNRAREAESVFIIAGENYGQGSSREHAAIAPRFLGVRAKVAKSFARIHKANLIYFGILPLRFDNPDDYDAINIGERLKIADIRKSIEQGEDTLEIKELQSGKTVKVKLEITDRERNILLAGGLINLAKH
jgi:aconitate hydratase